MKKTLLPLLLLFLSLVSYAQPRIGLTVSPGFSFTDVKYDPNDDTQVSKDGTALRAKFGLEFEFPLAPNYSFVTGLIFAPKKLSVKASNFDEIRTSIFNQTEQYKIQYLQIPVTLKLYTNEIQPDMKLFFQLGFMGEILLYSEPLDKDNVLIDKFRFFDVSFTGGVGVEYGAGINSLLYGGVFYDHGLVNVVNDQNNDLSADLSIRMHMLHLKLGIKF
ncbi:PorT family protein [Reichenbachiella agarivorans]|uniref:PorT family protein n=1 Tax=Reichenbachiella agarivorans TaxID=2979464 RepID=A0ABY6CSV5_9BACT|nr:porin family protein [Reichenbachiella agarivorans]UXP33573.1 PorT family protein [Reichenbachiella agarivorans]